MAEDMHQLLLRDDKGRSLAENAAAKLFRGVLLDIGIDGRSWDRLIRRYVTDPKNGIPNNSTKRSSARSNLNRALSKPKITWRTFRSAIALLGPKSVSYEVDLVWDPKLQLPNTPPTHLEHMPQSRQDELCQIVRGLFTELGVGPKVWDRLVERYLDRNITSVGHNPVDRSTERGNIRKTILNSNQYTWENFVKALNILGVVETTFTVKLNWGTKVTCQKHLINGTSK